MTKKIPLLIVGGGLGGLATALALSRRGIASHVAEKSRQFGEIGAGLQVAPNASRILHELGVMDEIRKSAVFPARLVFLDAVTGESVRSFDLGKPFIERYGHPYFVMHRGDLLDALLTACRASRLITLEPGKELASLEDLEDRARATFADGTVYECEALIGADGLHSTARRFVAADGEPVYHPYVAYRGAIPMSDVSKHAGLDNVVMYMGPGLHFVQYPLRRGELYNQVAVFESKRFKPGVNESRDDWGTADELDEAFSGTCDYVRGALKVIKRDRRWPMLDRLPLADWTRNRIALMGDAAHPMLQYLAQGACQAIEDAACLAEEIARSANDPAAAFLAYQNKRYLRTARVQTTARFSGEYLFHLAGVPRLLRNQMLEGSSPTDYGPIDWLYGHKN